MRYRARKCRGSGCGLRFPVDDGSPLGARCPVCGAETEFIDEPYATEPVRSKLTSNGPPVEALLDNVRSLRNVGSMFRTADGAGLRHLHLGGFTPTPDHPKLAKTALGAQASVPWTRHRDALAGARELVEAGSRLWALEGGSRAESLFGALAQLGDTKAPPIVLVVGHEVSGIDPRIVDLCERVVQIPMAGIKGSLNVGVALGVAAYFLRYANEVS